MSAARLSLSGIAADGHHGARPGEKDEAQQFSIDLDLLVDVGEDRIEQTIDYRTLTERVREIVHQESFDLIETMADRIARDCLERSRVLRVTVVVHKPNAALRLGLEDVTATVTAPEG
jgi:dihydroneopterin aldolase